MNMPPVPPPMSAPPPAPPKKSGALKWILIGCGGVGFVGLLLCGGCLLWGVSIGKSMMKLQEDVDSLVRNSPEVREDIGEVDSVDPADDQASSKKASEFVMMFNVRGKTGTGLAKARVKFDMKSFTLVALNYQAKDGRDIKLK